MLPSKVMPYLFQLAAPLMDSSIAQRFLGWHAYLERISIVKTLMGKKFECAFKNDMTPLWLTLYIKVGPDFLTVQCAVHSEQRMGEERCEIWYLGHESKPLVNIFPLTFWPSHFAVKIWNEGGLLVPAAAARWRLCAAAPPRR